MLNCLFWNFRSDDPLGEELITRLVAHHNVDILVLTESKLNSNALLGALRSVDPIFESPADQHRRFQIFTRFPGHFLARYREDDWISIRRLSIPGRKEILFAMIHSV